MNLYSPVLVFLIIGLPLLLSIFRFIRFMQKDWLSNDNPGQVLDNLINQRSEKRPKRPKIDFPEFFFIGIAPLCGNIFTALFSDLFKPFDLESAPTLAVYILLSWFAYWISRLYKHQVSNYLLNILPLGMYLGMILYPILALHFIAEISFAGILMMPYFGFALVAPLPALLYLIREHYLHRQFCEHKYSEQLFPQKPFTFGLGRWSIVLRFFLFLIVVQGVLMVAGQSWNSIFLAFSNSDGFLFSKTGSLLEKILKVTL